MNVTIKDYSGYNADCKTVKKILKYIDSKKECSLDDIFQKAELSYEDIIRFKQYLKSNKFTEFEEWANHKYSFERMFELHTKELNKLELARKTALEEVHRIEGLTPAKVYSYFRESQPYINDRSYNSCLLNVLDSIIAISNFEENDYFELTKVMSTKYACYANTERHYRIAIENNNNSAWKSIEKYLNRKPFIVDKKRCYEGFEFQISRTEYYGCTGWNQKGEIKFILSSKPNRAGQRKLLKFNYQQFKEYFKDKKIERVISM